jgi:hypothetical protein
MPRDSAHAPQLPLSVRDTAGYSGALAPYEAICHLVKGERSLPQQSQQTGINYWRLWQDLQRFRGDGLLGLTDRRTLPHAGNEKPTLEMRAGWEGEATRGKSRVCRP